jgi:hypothetical protein
VADGVSLITNTLTEQVTEILMFINHVKSERVMRHRLLSLQPLKPLVVSGHLTTVPDILVTLEKKTQKQFLFTYP